MKQISHSITFTLSLLIMVVVSTNLHSQENFHCHYYVDNSDSSIIRKNDIVKSEVFSTGYYTENDSSIHLSSIIFYNQLGNITTEIDFYDNSDTLAIFNHHYNQKSELIMTDGKWFPSEHDTLSYELIKYEYNSDGELILMKSYEGMTLMPRSQDEYYVEDLSVICKSKKSIDVEYKFVNCTLTKDGIKLESNNEPLFSIDRLNNIYCLSHNNYDTFYIYDADSNLLNREESYSDEGFQSSKSYKYQNQLVKTEYDTIGNNLFSITTYHHYISEK